MTILKSDPRPRANSLPNMVSAKCSEETSKNLELWIVQRGIVRLKRPRDGKECEHFDVVVSIESWSKGFFE